jgi:hypothetical protein
MERSKLALGLNEIDKNIYQTFLNGQVSLMNTDSNYHGNMFFAYSAYALYTNELHHIGVKMSSDDEEFLKENDNVYQDNKDSLRIWMENRETAKLAAFSQRLSTWEGANGANTVNTYQNRLVKIRDKEDTWNKIYLTLYILSACILAYAFFIDYKITKDFK